MFSAVTAGCSRSLQRPTRASTVKVPDNWTGGEVVPGAGQSVIGGTYFGDKELNQVVSRVLDRNQDLRAAVARIEAAEAQARIASASQLPQLDAGFDMGRRRQNFLGFPIPGAEGKVLSRTFSSAGLSLNLGWEVDLWGKGQGGEAGRNGQHASAAGGIGSGPLVTLGTSSQSLVFGDRSSRASRVGSVFGGELPDVGGTHSGSL